MRWVGFKAQSLRAQHDSAGTERQRLRFASLFHLPRQLDQKRCQNPNLLCGEIGFRHNCEAVGRSGLGDGSVSSKQTMATGGQIETDGRPMRYGKLTGTAVGLLP